MSSEFLSYIKTDISQTRYYPRTLAEGVLCENGDTLNNVLQNMDDNIFNVSEEVFGLMQAKRYNITQLNIDSWLTNNSNWGIDITKKTSYLFGLSDEELTEDFIQLENNICYNGLIPSIIGLSNAPNIKLSENYEASELENDDLEPTPGENIEVSIGKLHKSILDNEKVSATAITTMADSIGLTNTFEFQSDKFPDKTTLVDALESIGGGGGVEEITYSELNDLKNNSSLSPGTWYCVTDYTGSTGIPENARSLGINIKIFVMALTNNVLSESGYGVYNNIIYKLKYQDNIITEMLDSNNNLTCYDSINIQFKNSNDEYVSTFGNDCSNNTILSYNVWIDDSCSFIKVENGCQNITLDGTFENITIENNNKNLKLVNVNQQYLPIKNVIVHSCLSQNDDVEIINIDKENSDYLLEVSKNSQGSIMQYCLADLLSKAVYTSVEPESIFISGPGIITENTQYSLGTYPLNANLPEGITFEIDGDATVDETGYVNVNI